MRDFAQIKLSIWNDDSFLDLSNNAQLLYFVLISHPTMNRAGVGTWHAGRISGLCASWTRQDVERAACELIDGRFIVVDEDTDEFLVRTFVRHDGLMKQRNLATTMAREFAAVGSRAIKGVVVWELRRLHDEHPEFKGWQSDEALALLKKRAIDPSSDPSIHPQVDPSVDPSVYPSIDPKVKGEPKGSVDPSVDPSPTTATTTTTDLRRFQEGGTSEGVKGGPGGKGKPDTAGAEHPKTESPQPFYDGLDALADAHAHTNPTQAFGTIDDPRCAKHKDLDTAPPCWDCKKAGDTLKAQAEEEKHSRRTAIADCNLCDDNGMRDTGNGLTRCTHQPHLKAIGGPY